MTCALHPRYAGVRAPRSTKPGCTCAAIYAEASRPLRVLAIDPGERPGFAWLLPESLGVSSDPTPAGPWDAVVIEDQFLAKYIFRAGRRVRVSPKSQITLIRTAERMLLAHPAAAQYRLSPTVWRSALWPGSSRLSKTVVVARLRRDEPALLSGMTDDAVEARGILRAFLAMTPAQRKKYLVKT